MKGEEGSTGSMYREGRRRRAGEGRENDGGHYHAIDGATLTTTVTGLKEREVERRGRGGADRFQLGGS
jgi:hypothetical protein